MAAQQVFAAVLQGKHVQKHLKAHAVEHIAVVKVFFAGFIVHNPVVAVAAGLERLAAVEIHNDVTGGGAAIVEQIARFE